jgi:hypothetical protein
MQTDDTLMLGTDAFLLLEEKKIQEAQFRSKPKADAGGATGIQWMHTHDRSWQGRNPQAKRIRRKDQTGRHQGI